MKTDNNDNFDHFCKFEDGIDQIISSDAKLTKHAKLEGSFFTYAPIFKCLTSGTQNKYKNCQVRV